MAFVPVPRVVKGVIEWSQNGTPVVNVFHVDVGHSPTVGDCAIMGGVLLAWWEVTLAPNMHPSMVFSNITCTDISVPNGVQDIKTVTTVPHGTATGAALPGQTAVCVSQRTAFTGRSFRGRTYIGGLVDGYALNAQFLQPAAVAAVAGWYTTLQGLFNAVSQTLGVVSTIANKVHRVTGLITEITSILVDNKIDTQRRRSAN